VKKLIFEDDVSLMRYLLACSCEASSYRDQKGGQKRGTLVLGLEFLSPVDR
jgi:hypothetical protein